MSERVRFSRGLESSAVLVPGRLAMLLVTYMWRWRSGSTLALAVPVDPGSRELSSACSSPCLYVPLSAHARSSGGY